MRGILRPAVALLALVLCRPAVAMTPLIDVVAKEGLVLEWEPYLEIGRLRRGNRHLWFRTGGAWMSDEAGRLVSAPAPMKEGASLIVTDEVYAAIRRHFGTDKPRPLPYIGAIFIDPGHGGRDPGTIGRHDKGSLVLKEKDLVLAVGRYLDAKLTAAFPDKKIISTRSDDTYLSLEQRTDLANDLEIAPTQTVVFVSIHANASLNSAAKGFEVWYLPPDYRRDLIDPTSVDPETREILPILNTMLEEEFTVESVLLARSISEALDRAVGRLTENRGLKQETWFVVRKARMPSVLVELGFVTNPEEARRLADPDYLNKLAEAIYTGIVDFVNRFDSIRADKDRP